jgi:type VII secretion protein EccB
MQTRRDHLQAYRFGTGRLVSALLNGEPGAGTSPQHRSSFGTTLGIAATVLALAACAVYGAKAPASTDWGKAGPFLADRDTGAAYLYVGGRLHPVVNHTSALLALDGKVTRPTAVPRSDLDTLPRGLPLGIPAAPETVPPAAALLTGPWTYCVYPDRPGMSVIGFGQRAATAASGRAFVAGPNAARYVLWQGLRYPVRQRAVLVALGLDTAAPQPVPAPWLASLPMGTPLDPARVPAAGSPGLPVGGRPTRIGDPLTVATPGADRYYIVRADGLAPANATEAALLATAANRPVRQVRPGDIATTPVSADRSLLGRLPDLVSAAATAGGLCLSQQVAGGVLASAMVRPAGPAPRLGVRAIVPAGAGLLVQPPAARPGMAPRYLITDQGRKFRLGDDKAASALGYGSVPARTLPAYVLDLIPDGPALTVAAASRGQDA